MAVIFLWSNASIENRSEKSYERKLKKKNKKANLWLFFNLFFLTSEGAISIGNLYILEMMTT